MDCEAWLWSDKRSVPQIVSGSRDKTIKLWNTLGECKFTIAEGEGHTEWVSCVRFSPVTNKPIIVSAGWDRLVKVWNLTNCKLKGDLRGHRYYINTVTVSPDGSLCASGGKVRSFSGPSPLLCHPLCSACPPPVHTFPPPSSPPAYKHEIRFLASAEQRTNICVRESLLDKG